MNKGFDIKFEIFNNSNYRIWDGTITIEKDFLNKYGDYINSNTDYSSNPFNYVIVDSGQKVTDVFKLSFKEDFPESKITFNVIFEGRTGASCRCKSKPFTIKKEVTIVIHEKSTITEKIEQIIKNFIKSMSF